MKCRGTHTRTCVHTHTYTLKLTVPLSLPFTFSPLCLLPLVQSYKQRQTHTAGVFPNGKPSIERSFFHEHARTHKHIRKQTHTHNTNTNSFQGQSPLGNL